MSLAEKQVTHNSFGLVGITRCSCNAGMNFHGSDVKHSSFLTLKIRRSHIDRHLHKDWHHADERLIEIRLTHYQFSEMISNMNCGEGVPCTLIEVGGERMDETPDRSKKDEYVGEFSKDVDDLLAMFVDMKSDIEYLKEKSGATKKEKEALEGKVDAAIREIKSNMPFIKESFNKSLNKAVDDAKQNIEGHMLNLALNASRRGLVDEYEHQDLIENKQKFIEMSGD